MRSWPCSVLPKRQLPCPCTLIPHVILLVLREPHRLQQRHQLPFPNTCLDTLKKHKAHQRTFRSSRPLTFSSNLVLNSTALSRPFSLRAFCFLLICFVLLLFDFAEGWTEPDGVIIVAGSRLFLAIFAAVAAEAGLEEALLLDLGLEGPASALWDVMGVGTGC